MVKSDLSSLRSEPPSREYVGYQATRLWGGLSVFQILNLIFCQGGATPVVLSHFHTLLLQMAWFHLPTTRPGRDLVRSCPGPIKSPDIINTSSGSKVYSGGSGVCGRGGVVGRLDGSRPFNAPIAESSIWKRCILEGNSRLVPIKVFAKLTRQIYFYDFGI